MDEKGAVAGGPGADMVEGWAADFDLLMGRVGPCFARADLRGRADGDVRGLLGRVGRENGGQGAEDAGGDTPYRVPRLLGRGRGGADEGRGEGRRGPGRGPPAPGGR